MYNNNDYEELKTAKEFLIHYRKIIKSLKDNPEITEDQILEARHTLLRLELSSSKYNELKERYRKIYSIENFNDINFLTPYIESILNFFNKIGDRSIYLDKLNLLDIYIAASLYKDKIRRDVSSKIYKDCFISSVTATFDEIIQIYANDREGLYKEDEMGRIPVERIIYDYPDCIKLMCNVVTESIFEHQMSINTLMRLKDKENDVSILLTIPDSNKNDTIRHEESLGYFDLTVMEAIISLYSTGVTTMDLMSISKVMAYNKELRIAPKKAKSMNQTLLFDSIKKLCSYHIRINIQGKEQEDFLLNGDVKIINGKLCLSLKNTPILYEYANVNGQVLNVNMDELKIKISYTEEAIIIYRYLIDQIFRTFGTLKITNIGKDKKRHRNPLKIASTDIYKLIPFHGKDERSKQRRIREHIKVILDEMKQNGFISSYEIYGTGKNTYYILKRENTSEHS